MNAFDLIIDNCKMYAILKATEKEEDRISDIKMLMQHLKKKSISKGININEAKKAFTELKDLTEEKKYLIARGRAPDHGKNGVIKYEVDVTGKSTFKTSDNNSTESIDYKQSMSISEVNPGDKIGYFIPPTNGKSGYNIFGKTLPARNGKVAKLALSDGVELTEDNTTIIATKKGRPILNNNTLSVTSYYEVTGDVCYETGNICFDGDVYITGSVLDDFSVKAKNIEICGNIGNSQIHSSGNLIVRGGISGNNSGTIKCLANVEIKYVNNAKLIVNKDLNVEKGIVNSIIKCLGVVKAQKIRGGNVTALKGIHTQIVGSMSGVPTLLEPGINYKIKEINETQMTLDLKIKSILLQFNHNFGSRSYFKKCSNSTKQKIKAAHSEFDIIKEIYLKALNSKKMMLQNAALHPISKVLISKKLYTDVTVSTQSCFKHFTKESSGPICLIENIQFSSIDIESINCNNKELEKYMKASDMEEGDTSCHLNIVGAHSETSLTEIEKKFTQMIDGQQFYVCIIEKDYSKRVTIERELKNAGIENILIIEELKSLMLTLFEYSGKDIALIYSALTNIEGTLKLFTRIVSGSPHYYSIILDNHNLSNFIKLPDKESSLSVISGKFRTEHIIKKLNNFGMYI